MVREPLPVHAAGAVVSPRVFNLFNFTAYQAAWFAAVVGAAQGFAWTGSAVALAVTGVHVAHRRDTVELKLIGASAGIGILVDSTLAITGQVRFASAWPQSLAPFWMVCLWMAFATTLNHSLRWLMNRPVAAGLAGALGGPLALSIVTPAVTLPIIALLWTIAMVALSMIVLRASLVPAAGRMPA
jgi:hypothetical protein